MVGDSSKVAELTNYYEGEESSVYDENLSFSQSH